MIHAVEECEDRRLQKEPLLSDTGDEVLIVAVRK